MALLLARTGVLSAGGPGMKKARCASSTGYPAGIHDWVLDGMKMTSPGLLFLCVSPLVLFFDNACKVTGARRSSRHAGTEGQAIYASELYV